MLLISMLTRCLKCYLMMKFNFDTIVELEDIINNPDDSDIGYFIEFDLK